MSIDGVSGERWSAARDAGAARCRTCLSVRVSVLGAWTIVAIVGEMDLLVVPLISGLVDADARHLVFELRQVTFMDGRGLDLLLRSQRDALKAGGCVRLVAPSRKVRRLLMLTGSNREFTTFESVDEATSVPAPAPRGSSSSNGPRTPEGCGKGRMKGDGRSSLCWVATADPRGGSTIGELRPYRLAARFSREDTPIVAQLLHDRDATPVRVQGPRRDDRRLDR